MIAATDARRPNDHACDGCGGAGLRADRDVNYDAATGAWICGRCWFHPRRPAEQWPETVPGCGVRIKLVGAPDHCLHCDGDTGSTYGALRVPLCLGCARRRAPAVPEPAP